jgi:ribosomal protein L10
MSKIATKYSEKFIDEIINNVNQYIATQTRIREEARERYSVAKDTFCELNAEEYNEALRRTELAKLNNNLNTLNEFTKHFLALTSSFEEIQRATQEIVEFLNENNQTSLELFISEETQRIDIKERTTNNKIILDLLNQEKVLLKYISEWCEKRFFNDFLSQN